MKSDRALMWLLGSLGASVLLCGGCQGASPSAATAASDADGASTGASVARAGAAAAVTRGRGDGVGGPAAKIPLAKLIAGVQVEVDAMGEIWKQDYDTGRLLGKINGAFQERGYFSRIPSAPVVEPVESNLRHLASQHALLVENVSYELPPAKKSARRVLKPGERWQPTKDELFGTIRLTIDLQGPVAAAARMIDEMPEKMERLVLVTGDESRAGGVRLHALCWFERALPMPRIEIPWPELEERLEAAGHDPDDPALQDNQQIAKLRELIEVGRRRLVDVRNTLAVASDFPRWLLRHKFFDEKSLEVQSVRGAEVLGTVAAP